MQGMRLAIKITYSTFYNTIEEQVRQELKISSVFNISKPISRYGINLTLVI